MRSERRFAPIPHSLTFDSNLGSEEKALYQLIAASSFRHGYAYFSLSYITLMLKIGRTKTVEAIKNLELTGWILAFRGISSTTRYIPLDEHGITLYPIKNSEVRKAVENAKCSVLTA